MSSLYSGGPYAQQNVFYCGKKGEPILGDSQQSLALLLSLSQFSHLKNKLSDINFLFKTLKNVDFLNY